MVKHAYFHGMKLDTKRFSRGLKMKRIKRSYLYKRGPRGGVKYWIRGMVDGCYVLRYWRKSKQCWEYVIESHLLYLLELGMFSPWKGRHDGITQIRMSLVTDVPYDPDNDPYLLIRYKSK